MNDFIYYAPTKVFFGKKAEENIGSALNNFGFKKVLLHYGGGSIKKSGLYDKVVGQLKSAGIDFIELGGVEANPKIGLIREGLELCKREGVDFILAVGGGSVIDSAKSMSIGLANNTDPWEMIEKLQVPEKALPVGAVLTLAAAGSEMSNSHVVSNPEIKMKRGYNHDLLRPVVIFMNPENTFTVSRHQTGCGVVDIMTHTLERYFTPDTDADLMDRISEGLLVSVKNAGTAAIRTPNDYEARATLMWASSLSHNGLTGCGKNGPWAAHKMEHDISGLFDNVAHGAGLSVLFPAWSRFVCKHDVRKFSQIATRVWGVDMDFEHPEKTAHAGIDAMEAYFRSLGMPTKMAEIGVTPDVFEKLADMTTSNGTKQLASYVPLGKTEIMEIYKLAQ